MLFKALLAPIKVAFTYTGKKPFYLILKTLFIIIFTIPYLLLVLMDLIINIALCFGRYLPLLGFIFLLICWIADLFPVLFFNILTIPDMIFQRKELKILLAELEHREELDELFNLMLCGVISMEEYIRKRKHILGQYVD